ncbi:MAG: glycosyltransferase family 2 protein [Nitrospirota bacterium]
MLPLSIVIITQNEEQNIREALQSIRNKVEIIIVDAFSKDKTLEICKKYTEKIYQSEWAGFARQKQKAVELAGEPWVFILDSDERFSEPLWREIEYAVKSNKTFSGYYVPRKNFFLGRWIRHGGWWPDHTLRLFLKDKARLEDRRIHERVVVDGETGYLRGHLEHYTYRTVSDYIKKMDIYSALAAKELKAQGINSGKTKLIFNPAFTFFKMFILRRGFMDGVHGLILATLYSYYTFLKYLRLWEESNADN